MAVEVYNFPTHKKGDTFNGITFSVLVNTAPLDLSGATIIGTFKLSLNDKIIKVLSTGNEKITISSSPGVFMVNKQVIDWPVGEYNYDIVFQLKNQEVKTYIKGVWFITE